MSDTVRYITVYFDETLWSFWSLPWFASLKEMAHPQCNVLVVDGGIPEKAKSFLNGLGVIIVPLVKKHNVPEIDVIHTLAAYSKNNKGLYAFWDCASYFQVPIESVFDIAPEKLVCCRESSSPQPFLRQTLEAFGITEEVTNNSPKLYAILKKVAKQYGRTMCGGFFASSDHILRYYDAFLSFCIDSGFLVANSNAHQIALDMFLVMCDFGKVVDETWNAPIAHQMEWIDNAFRVNGEKAKVVYIPHNMQYSAESAMFHFRNRYPAEHDKWKCIYKGNSFAPKRVIKSSLSKLKKVT